MTDEDTTVEISDEDFETEVDVEEFVEALYTIEDVRDEVRAVREELNKLRRGPLKENHVKAILYSEIHSATKSDISELFETADEIDRTDEGELATRLIASMSNLTLNETDELLDELEHLDDVYGDRLREDLDDA